MAQQLFEGQTSLDAIAEVKVIQSFQAGYPTVLRVRFEMCSV
jgi:hypothetical protein